MQYYHIRLLAKDGCDKVGHRWAYNTLREHGYSLLEPIGQLRALEGNMQPEDNPPT